MLQMGHFTKLQHSCPNWKKLEVKTFILIIKIIILIAFNSIVIPWDTQSKLKTNLIGPVFNNIQHIWDKSHEVLLQESFWSIVPTEMVMKAARYYADLGMKSFFCIHLFYKLELQLLITNESPTILIVFKKKNTQFKNILISLYTFLFLSSFMTVNWISLSSGHSKTPTFFRPRATSRREGNFFS